jgi:hypothetical protein
MLCVKDRLLGSLGVDGSWEDEGDQRRAEQGTETVAGTGLHGTSFCELSRLMMGTPKEMGKGNLTRDGTDLYRVVDESKLPARLQGGGQATEAAMDLRPRKARFTSLSLLVGPPADPKPRMTRP